MVTSLFWFNGATVNALQVTDSFPYDSVFWEDWKKAGGGTASDSVIVCEDTYVVQSNPSVKNGGNNEVGMDDNPSGERWTFVKFDLSSYSGVTLSSVTMYIYCYQSGKTEDYNFYPVHNQTWMETDTCWNDKPVADTATLLSQGTCIAVGWWTISSAALLNHTQSYLGFNCSIMGYDTDGYDAQANWHRTKEFDTDYCIYLELSFIGSEIDVTWNNNSTVTIESSYSGSTYANVSMYRNLEVSFTSNKLEASCMLRTNASANYVNATLFTVNYLFGDSLRTYGIYLASDYIGFIYYNWSSQFTIYNYSYSINFDMFYTLEITVDAYTRSIEVEVSNSTSEILDKVFYSETIPAQAKNVSILNNHCNSSTIVNLVWVDAPFESVSGLREWVGENTGDEAGENPYWLNQTDTDVEQFYVKCMPFQGYKTQFNWSIERGSAFPRIVSSTVIQWYHRNGSAMGYVVFSIKDWLSYTSFNVLSYSLVGGSVNLLDRVVADEGEMNFALWVEKSGSVYAYVQTSPHSSDYSDFWVFDVTDCANLDSWGVMITHTSMYYESDHLGNSFQWRETEIFYGAREGISQPRFGGMWWLVNPLAWFVTAIIATIQTALYPLALAIHQFFKPFNDAMTAGLDAMFPFLEDITNIFSVIGSIVVDLVAEFVAEFIVPLWEYLQETIFPLLVGWFFSNLITQINSVLASVHVFLTGILSVLSLAMYGDATILPTGYTNFVTFSQSLFYGIGSAFVQMGQFVVFLINIVTGQPVTAYVMPTGGMSFIFTIFYYVVTYLPIVIFMHLLLTTLSAVGQQSIEPLIGLALFYFSIMKIIFDVLMSIVGALVSLISMIGNYIPFT